MVRCFIGIFLPDGLKANAVKIQNIIASSDAECKLVECENMHITLSFLGEIDGNRADEIGRLLDGILAKYKKFNVSIAGIKFIPNRDFIRVIALDVIDESGVLGKISDEIKANIGGDVKPPHFTLCRLRSPAGKQNVVSRLLDADSHCGELFIDSVDLIKSELKRDGPVYTSAHKTKLAD